VGILKFTRKFLTMVCLGMILMHTVGNGKEVIPRAEAFGVGVEPYFFSYGESC
jgi:hypothetical protein